MKRDIIISTDKAKLDLPLIHAYLSQTSYWAKGRSLEEVVCSIENSLCFGAYTHEGRQVGFARVVTDGVVFAWLMDVFVTEGARGKGIGKMLLAHLLDHELIRKANGIGLRTRDAHGLYRQFGFGGIPDADGWMYRGNRRRV
jgi:GNAT superfamily N-acetyltransferase